MMVVQKNKLPDRITPPGGLAELIMQFQREARAAKESEAARLLTTAKTAQTIAETNRLQQELQERMMVAQSAADAANAKNRFHAAFFGASAANAPALAQADLMKNLGEARSAAAGADLAEARASLAKASVPYADVLARLEVDEKAAGVEAARSGAALTQQNAKAAERANKLGEEFDRPQREAALRELEQNIELSRQTFNLNKSQIEANLREAEAARVRAAMQTFSNLAAALGTPQGAATLSYLRENQQMAAQIGIDARVLSALEQVHRLVAAQPVMSPEARNTEAALLQVMMSPVSDNEGRMRAARALAQLKLGPAAFRDQVESYAQDLIRAIESVHQGAPTSSVQQLLNEMALLRSPMQTPGQPDETEDYGPIGSPPPTIGLPDVRTPRVGEVYRSSGRVMVMTENGPVELTPQMVDRIMGR